MRGFGKVSKAKYILSNVANRNNILHLGCTSSPNTRDRWDSKTHLHRNLYDLVCTEDAELVGVDIDDEALGFLRQHLPKAELIHGDAHDLQACLGDRKFDLIIAADIIEHLSNPGLFLHSCLGQMKPGGELLITTVNTFGIIRFLKALLFYESVHPDHTAYYSHKTLSQLLESNGFSVISCGYYAAEPLRVKLTIGRFFSNPLEACIATIWPQFSEGVVITSSVDATRLAISR